MDERIKTNLLLWNDAVEVHARSAFYDLDGFKRVGKTLHSIEIECLKPGGFFNIVDMHPFVSIIDYAGSHDALRVELSYFRTDVIVDTAQPDYADPTHIGKHEGHEWIHTVGEIQNSLIEAGLQIDFWHEFPVCVWQCLEAAKRGADGYYRIKGDPIPLLFSVKATKQA